MDEAAAASNRRTSRGTWTPTRPTLMGSVKAVAPPAVPTSLRLTWRLRLPTCKENNSVHDAARKSEDAVSKVSNAPQTTCD